MDLSRLKESDQFGRFYLKIPGNERYGNYFRSIDALRLFLEGRDWQRAVTGYYLNVAGDRDAVRLSYFSDDPDKAFAAIDGLYEEGRIVEAERPQLPFKASVACIYGNEELRFRKFLYTYTLIGLDIMKADLLNARCLMATFRWQVMLGRLPARPHFENTFSAGSASYNALSGAEKEQFWNDLGHWPNPPQVDWAHMMVNMILPGDWNHKGMWEHFLVPAQPKTVEEINEYLQDWDFRIPKGWRV